MASSEIAPAQASVRRDPPAIDLARDALERAGVLARLDEVRRITERLFPGEVSYAIESDPEIASEHYAVFDVSAPEDYAEISRRRREWFQQTYNLLGDDCDKVRLSIGVRS